MSRPGGRPLRVVELVQALDVGGLEVVVVELAEGLNASGVEVTVIGTDRLGSVGERLDRTGVPALALDARPGLDPRALARLVRELRDRAVDVVHAHNERAHLYAAMAARLVGAAVLVNTRHGRNEPDSPRGPLRRRLLSFVTDAIIAVSRDVEQVATVRDRIRPAKVLTIYNGVHVPAAAPDRLAREQARALLGLPAQSLIIGTVGRLAPEKDYAMLLSAFAALQEQGGPAATSPGSLLLALIGDGPQRQLLEEQAALRGIREQVVFLGQQRDVPRLLPAFDIFAQSSLTEGISLTILEAMAAALPVVVTAVGGNLEIVSEGTGVLVPAQAPVPMARALGELARDPERRQALGRAARQRVAERFSRERMVREHLTLYQRLLARRRQ